METTNRKPFNLEQARAWKPVINVQKSRLEFIAERNGIVCFYNPDIGCFVGYHTSEFDQLFMAPDEVVMYVGLFPSISGNGYFPVASSSKESIETGRGLVGEVKKVTWEI